MRKRFRYAVVVSIIIVSIIFDLIVIPNIINESIVHNVRKKIIISQDKHSRLNPAFILGGDAVPRLQFATRHRYRRDDVLPALRKIIIALLSFGRTCRRRYVISASSRERMSPILSALLML